MTSFGLHLTDFQGASLAGNRLLTGVTDITAAMEASSGLERPARDATKYLIDHDFHAGFESAIEAVSGQSRTA